MKFYYIEYITKKSNLLSSTSVKNKLAMRKSIFNYSLTLITAFSITNCTTPGSEESTDVLTPPVAEKIEKQLTNLGDTRIDNYYWMRLTDEQKKMPKHQMNKLKK